MAPDGNLIAMEVTARRELTKQVTELVLEPLDAGILPGFTAGAHITVRTPAGAMRRYSLVGSNDDTPRSYKIAIKREPNSRGGSASMHDQAPIGTQLKIETPENSFPLADVPKYLLIAGGIGVTPIYSMALQLASQGKDFRVIYCTRSREEAAYIDEMEKQFGDRLTSHYDDGDLTKVYDFWDHFKDVQKLNVYCCGPKPLIEEIRALSGHWPEGRVNFEDFKPVEIVRADDAAFNVKLKGTGKTITVPKDKSILEALRDAGMPVVSSCESGTCGTCKTRLLSGEVDHRDMVLMDEEKQDHIMICVSRARSGDLVLDL